MEDLFELLVVGVGVVAVLIYQAIKSSQEAKQREETRRRLQDSSPPQTKQATPERPAPKTGGGSLLDQFRDLMEAAREPKRPQKPPPQKPPERRPAPRRIEPVRPVFEERPKPAPKPQRATSRVVRRRATSTPAPAPPPEPSREYVASRREVPLGTGAAMTAPERGEGARSLGDILDSARADLAKAVLLGEILGNPVAKRRGRVPRHRA